MKLGEIVSRDDAPAAGPETQRPKPCPFCGDGRARVFMGGDEHYVGCVRMGCEAQGAAYVEPVAAVEAWNRRAGVRQIKTLESPWDVALRICAFMEAEAAKSFEVDISGRDYHEGVRCCAASIANRIRDAMKAAK